MEKAPLNRDTPSAPAQDSASGLDPGNPVRVLLIEDTEQDVVLIKAALDPRRSPGNFLVRRAGSLREASEVVVEVPFDLILLDLSLPDSGGRETIRRGLDLAGPTPLIVLTGLEDDGLALEAVHAGAQDYVIKRRSGLKALPRVAAQAIERHRTLVELQAAKEELRDKAYRDSLTGLPNRGYFLEHLSQDLAIARRYGHRLALLFVDLDHFKKINDTLGHQAGDWLLRSVARLLQATVRESDSICRYAGDEFLVLLRDLSDPLDALAVARKLLNGIRTPLGGGGNGAGITPGASIGIALYPKDGQTAEELIQNADTAMYAAKEKGGSALFFSDSEDPDNANQSFGLYQRIYAGLQSGEFQVYYQPVVDGTDGSVLGVEALSRWLHPDRGILFPREFMEHLAMVGLFSDLSEQVLRTASRQFKDWMKEGRDHLQDVSVNLAHSQLVDLDFPHRLEVIMNETGLHPPNLQVELPSRVVEAEKGVEGRVVGAIREMGIKVILDDLGVESVNLARLRRMNVDGFKLDRSLVQNSDLQEPDRAILSALVRMAYDMGLVVTAEGVERPEQRDLLLEMGCSRMQGFLFGRPVPASAFWGPDA